MPKSLSTILAAISAESAGSWKTMAVALWLVAAAPAAAQFDDPEAGRIIGRAIAAGVALATDDFASSGSFNVDDDANSSFRVQQMGWRHGFESSSRWEPFLGGRVGRVLVDQELDLGGTDRAPLDLDVWGLAIEGGTRVRFGSGWFSEIRGEVSYSFVENRLEYPSPELAETLAPLLDGVLFNWEAEAVTLEAGLGIGWERHSDRGVRTTLEAELTRLRTDPRATDHPVQDVTVETHFERLLASFEIPLGIEAFGRPLRLDTRLRHTFLGDDLAQPLDSNGFTDLNLALLALWPETSRLPVPGIGLAVTYTTAEAFEGWSAGVTFGR